MTSKRDLLEKAIIELNRQQKYIEELVAEIEVEDLRGCQAQALSQDEILTAEEKVDKYLEKMKTDDSVFLTSLEEAERVIEAMNQIVEKFGTVLVSDLHDLLGIRSTHKDSNRGWTDSFTNDLIQKGPTGYWVEFPLAKNLKGRQAQALG